MCVADVGCLFVKCRVRMGSVVLSVTALAVKWWFHTRVCSAMGVLTPDWAGSAQVEALVVWV